MIAETLKETENKWDEPKRKLNWSYLEKSVNLRVKEKEKSQVKAFKNNHFVKKKNV